MTNPFNTVRYICLALFLIYLQTDKTFSQFYLSDSDSIPEEGEVVYNIKITEILASNLTVNTDEKGDFEDWVELYNFGDESVNLRDCYITDDKNILKFKFSEDVNIDPEEYILIWADEECGDGPLHINFKLNGNGETIYLFASDSITLIDSLNYGRQKADISFGRLKGDFSKYNYFDIPTPLAENPSTGFYQIIAPPVCLKPSGFYKQPFYLSVFHPDPDVKIYYTLDCSEPTTGSLLYSGNILLDTTTILRCIAVKEGFVNSDIVTNSYFFSPDYNLDVISLVSDKNNIYGSQGIMSKDVEKPVHIEYFGSDDLLKFHLNGGITRHSPVSNSQVAFRLYARSEYGEKDIDYKIFDQKNINDFKRLVLRNAGNDGVAAANKSRTHMRDPIIHVLFNKIDTRNAISAYKPVHVYLDGSYFGIYNLRERIDRFYIKENFGYEGNMDLLEMAFGFPGNRNAIEGDWHMYDSLTHFMNNNNIADDYNFSIVEKMVDVDRFLDYWIHEVFVGNLDWFTNNIKIFRPRTENGKFTWILWDVDHGLGLPYQNYGSPDWNTLAWSLSTDQVRTTGGGSNIIHRNIIKNQTVKNKFISRFADLLNTYYSPEYTNFLVDSMKNALYPDFNYEIQRWGKLTFDAWISSIEEVKNYLKVRPDKMRTFIKDYFNLSKIYTLTVKTNDEINGTVQVNSIKSVINNNSVWTGKYFSGVPVTLEAVPSDGFKFKEWKNIASDNPCITVNLISDSTFEAVFEPLGADSNRIIINELSYFDPIDNTGDWIELYNGSGLERDISDWKILINSNEYAITNTSLNVDEYYLVSGIDLPVTKTIVLLTNPEGKVIDSVCYDIKDQWPAISFDRENIIELINPLSNNSKPESWRSSIILKGTPGSPNFKGEPNYTGLLINEIMTLNSCINDEFGDFDNWIELYNSGSATIDLRGLIFKDGLNFTLGQINYDNNDYFLKPYDYAVIWADKENEGPFHLNFKLDDNKGEIKIIQNNGKELTTIDKVEYSSMDGNHSFGRRSDGLNSWSYMAPTPGAKNDFIYSDIKQDDVINSTFRIYPNPASSFLNIECKKEIQEETRIELQDVTGKVWFKVTLQSRTGILKVDLNNFNPGFYLIKISGKSFGTETRIIIISK